MTDDLDVLILGAGLSGIGAACHLTRRHPATTYAVLEARAASGGTWDLFRYPGIRSDSDMFTLGYRFRPWTGATALAEEPFLDFRAGYVLRALDQLPVQGAREPWRLRQSYLHDVRTIRSAPIDDGALAFR